MGSMTQRPLTESEKSELADLNAGVVAAIQARRVWLDAKMYECSRLQIGDDIYDLDSGAKLGKVTELYRYSRDRDEGVRDTHAYCDYRYEMYRGCFDNTSRQGTLFFGTHDDAIAHAERRVSRLRGSTS